MRRADGIRVSDRAYLGPPIPRGGLLLLILLVASACVSFGQTTGQSLQADEEPSTIRGTVINALTGAPIPRALVSSGDSRFAKLTDAEGHFEFTRPKPDNPNGIRFFPGGQPHQEWLVPGLDNTWFSARKPGFLDDPDDRRPAEKSPSGEITIPLMPEGLIKGRVITSETDPAVGVTVQMFSRQVEDGMPKWMPAGTVRANSDGEFRFAELRPGTYKLGTTELMDNDPVTMVAGSQYGFPPVYFPGVSDYAAAGTITLAAGQTVEADIPLTRQPYYPVRIPVANPSANGGMNVTVSVLGHKGPGYSLGYNSDKQRIEGSLPNGHYLVEATTWGQNATNGVVNLAVSGAPADGPAMTLVPSSAIPVHVTEQFTSSERNGSQGWNVGGRSFEVHGPRTYLNVMAVPVDDFQRRGNLSPRPPTGPDDNSLVIENVVPGEYRLQVFTARGYIAAAMMGTVDLLRGPFVVSAGSSAPIEVTVRDDYAEMDVTVTGLSTESAGGPLGEATSAPAVWVYCVPLPDSDGQFREFGGSADGAFSSPTMPPGAYRVLALRKPQSHLPYRDSEAMKAYDTLGPVVHLSAGQKTSVQVQVISSE